MAVRTKTLAAATAASGTLTTVYTVAANETAIVKDVRIGKFGTAGSDITVSVLRAGTAYALHFQTLGIGSAMSIFQGFVVLLPGDALRVLSSSGSVSVWVSGAELEGVAD